MEESLASQAGPRKSPDSTWTRRGFDLVPVHHEYAGCPDSVTYVACESYAEGYQRAKSKYHYPTEQE